MANQEHLDMLAKGVESWNAWRNEHPEVRPNLTGAVLTDAHLEDAYPFGANLSAQTWKARR